MKRTIVPAMLAVSMIALLVSCSKESSKRALTPLPVGNNPTVEELIIGDWITTALTVDPPIEEGGVYYTDYFSTFDACTKDDIVRFNADKTFVFEEGKTKCDPFDEQIIDEGTYILDSNGVNLTLISTTDVNEIKIKTISKTRMVVEYTESGSVEDYTFTQTLVKQ